MDRETEVDVVARPDGAPDRDWWRRAVVYQIYLRSFADGNADGIGDIPGIRSRLDYLAQLGVDALWITPWYRSPMADGGYDVADYRSIDPSFGTLDDAVALAEEVHARGMRLLVDMVPNHTSSEHPWFRAALAAARGSSERSRYYFRDGRGAMGDEPPNNWPSAFGGSAWTRVPDTDGSPGQWYLHLFSPQQPDLDWTNAQVRADFEGTLRFWFDRGIDGLRIDVAMCLAKDPALPDLVGDGLLSGRAPWVEARHPYVDRDGVHEIWRAWRRIADAYRPARVYVGEVPLTRPDRLAAYVRPDELHTVFNFDFLKCPWDATALRAAIQRTVGALSVVGAPATWVLSNHDEPRHLSRFGWPDTQWRHPLQPPQGEPDLLLGMRRARAAVLLMGALPGGMYVYQGEELGLEQVLDLPDDVLRDPTWERSGHTICGRDGCRVPLPWSGDAPPFDFTADRVQPWLPQPPRWATRTAEAQAEDPDSMLSLYRRALATRRSHPGFAGERLVWLPAPDGVLHFEREAGVTCLVNVSADPIPLPDGRVLIRSDAPAAPGDLLPPGAAAWCEP